VKPTRHDHGIRSLAAGAGLPNPNELPLTTQQWLTAGQ